MKWIRKKIPNLEVEMSKMERNCEHAFCTLLDRSTAHKCDQQEIGAESLSFCGKPALHYHLHSEINTQVEGHVNEISDGLMLWKHNSI